MTFNSSFESSRYKEIQFDNDFIQFQSQSAKISIQNLKNQKLEKTTELYIWRFYLKNELNGVINLAFL